MSNLVDAVAPGDVHAIANTGARLRACSDAVAEIRRDLSDNRTADIWSGLAAEQFDEARRDVVDALRGVAERFGRTGEALTVHAQRLDGLQARARILALHTDQLSREVAAGERALKLARGSDDPMSLAEDRAREHLDALKYQRRSLERAMHELRDEWDRLGMDTAHAIDEARDELDDRRSVWGMAGSVLRGISRRLPGGGVFDAFAGLFGDDARDALDASENFMTPAGVYALLSRWDRSELEKFAEAEYELVSHLDGAPAWMRDIANRRKVQDEIERLRGGGSELDLAAASWYE